MQHSLLIHRSLKHLDNLVPVSKFFVDSLTNHNINNVWCRWDARSRSVVTKNAGKSVTAIPHTQKCAHLYCPLSACFNIRYKVVTFTFLNFETTIQMLAVLDSLNLYVECYTNLWNHVTTEQSRKMDYEQQARRGRFPSNCEQFQ